MGSTSTILHSHYSKFFPTRQEGVVRFDVEIRVCDPSTPRPHPVSRQSSSPIPSSIPPEQLASGSRRVSGQYRAGAACQHSPVDPAQYPARTARQCIPLSIFTGGSCRVSGQYRAGAACQHSPVDPPVSRQSSSPVWFCLMSKRADGNLESKSLGCGGICCNDRKLVSVEGGDCSKRSNFVFSRFFACPRCGNNGG